MFVTDTVLPPYCCVVLVGMYVDLFNVVSLIQGQSAVMSATKIYSI